MLKKITIKKVSIEVGSVFDANQFPSCGIYMNKKDMCYYLVYQMSGMTQRTVMSLGMYPFPSINDEEDDEAVPAIEGIAAAPMSSMVSANDLLKAIAISQHPELAKDLCT